MEKYGFVYIWFDRKHKRFYVGSHWGSEDDGYICSSNWMRDAYRKRPIDFRRRILSRVYSSRADLLNKEFEWLNLISESELGVRYYNRTKYMNGHWFTEEHRRSTMSQRISENTKAAMNREDVRKKYLKGLKKRDTKSSDPIVREKRRQSMKQAMAKKFPIEERKPKPVEFGSEEYRNNMASSVAESWKLRDKKAIGSKISESLAKSKESRSKAQSALKWYNNGTMNTRSAENPGDGWVAGRLCK